MQDLVPNSVHHLPPRQGSCFFLDENGHSQIHSYSKRQMSLLSVYTFSHLRHYQIDHVFHRNGL